MISGVRWGVTYPACLGLKGQTLFCLEIGTTWSQQQKPDRRQVWSVNHLVSWDQVVSIKKTSGNIFQAFLRALIQVLDPDVEWGRWRTTFLVIVALTENWGRWETKSSRLRSQVPGLRSQVSGLRSQVSGLRSQVSGLRSQVSGLRSQVSGLRSDHNQSYQVIQNVNSWVLIVVGRRMGVFSDKSTYWVIMTGRGGGWVIITLQVATESLDYAINC